MNPQQHTKQFVPIATTNEDQELFAKMLRQKEFDAAQQPQSTEHLPNKVLPPPTALPYASSLNRDYDQSIADMLKNRRKSLSEQEKQTYKDAREPQLKGRHNFRILKTFSWEWILILCGMLASAVYGVMPLVFYLIFGTFVDDAINYAKLDISAQELRDNIVNYTIGFACIGVGGGLSSFLSQMFMNIAGDRLAIRLRRTYFDALISQEMGFFDIKSSGALTAPIFEDVAKIQDAYTMKLSLVCTHIATAIAGVIMALTTNWKMTLILISCAPVVMVVIIICTKCIEVFTNRINNATMKAAGVAGEVSSSIKTIRSMAGDRREKARFGKALAAAPLSIIGKGVSQGIAMGNSYMVINGFFALTFWYGGSIVIDGDATLGEMVKVFGIMLLSILGLNQAADNLPYFAKANSSQQALLKVILREPEITEPINGKKIENLKGEITVEGIEFAYPSRPHLTILKDFNLTIKAGTSVALVGGSGSGKSTIIGLLERFYVPQKGRVLLDGVDIKELDTEWLHQVIGIVTQEPTLFQGTIKENIAYSIGGLTGSKKDAKQSQIEEAAKAANAHNFIMELPNGYNTRLGEKGVSLSGGQKQRIAIARAILQNPQILLLDEATSALDAESEGLVQEALDRLMKGRTTICVAHRLATIKNSDEICVMDHGVIRERGTHEDLIRNPNGMYRSLAAKQSMV